MRAIVSSVRTSTQRTIATLTLTEAALLALLSIEGERSGYDLLKLVGKSIGHVWRPAKTQLYAVLPRLVTDGFATQRTVVEGRAPEKQLYRITRAGTEALRHWLDEPDPRAREAFYLRLFVGGFVDPARLIEHVERYRDEVEAELAVLREIEPTNSRQGHDLYHGFLLDLGLEELALRIRWADGVLKELKCL